VEFATLFGYSRRTTRLATGIAIAVGLLALVGVVTALRMGGSGPSDATRTAKKVRAESADFTALTSAGQTLSEARNAICHSAKQTEGHEELFMSAEGYTPEQATSLMNQGQWLVGGRSFPVGKTIDWARTESFDRSEKFTFHSWTLLYPVALYYEENRRAETLDWIFAQTVSYTDGRFFSDNDYRVDKSGSYVWYDMAAGHRARLLGYILSETACDKGRYPDDAFERLFRFAADHVSYLRSDRYFVAHNNHGLFQSIGLASLCHRVSVLSGCEDSRALAEARLREYLESKIADGILLEHSAMYNAAILKTIVSISSIDSIFAPEFARDMSTLANDMIDNIDIFLTTNGTAPQIGDTFDSTFDMEALEGICAAMGRAERCLDPTRQTGVKTVDGGRVVYLAKQAGYAGFRETSRLRPDGAYLLMNGAFHSRVHKHVDDLSFVYSDLGMDIVVDAGAFGYLRPPGVELTKAQKDLGYYYSDPQRIYAESIHAHNTVEVNGASPSRASLPPYGAADLRVATIGDNIAVTGSVPRADFKEGGIHKRILLSKPGAYLLVLDYLTRTPEQSGAPSKDRYTVWHHFNPDFEIEAFDEETASLRLKSPGMTIEAFPVDARHGDARAVIGQTEPRLQGWQSPGKSKLTPAVAYGVDYEMDALESGLLLSLNGAVRTAWLEPKGEHQKVIVELRDGTREEFDWHPAKGEVNPASH
jgi:Heparinase II/III-like protein